jgi:signal transduction histidine kinase/ligand-binding sensor domain-containing protein
MLHRALTVRAKARFSSTAAMCVLCFVGGRALAQGATLLEMDHKSWTARDGAPQGVTALTQASDDVLWIGTEGGVFSFDGHTFSAFHPQPGEPDLPAGPVTTVLATRDGAVWAGFRYGGVARISQGHVKQFAEADGLQIGSVKHIRQTSGGELWALRQQTDLIRFGADGAWHVEPTPLGDAGGLLHYIFIDSTDTLWLDQGGRLFRRPLNQRSYFATEAQADYLFGITETPEHSLWLSDSMTRPPGHPVGRTQHIDRAGKLLTRLPDNDNVADILYASDGSLIMLPIGGGIVRISAQQLAALAPAGRTARHDTFGQEGGLSSDSLAVLLLDRDGNLWAGGQRGLDRFRTARLVPFSPKDRGAATARGLGRTANLCAGSDGAVWITGDRLELYKSSGGTIKLFHTTGQVYSMSCGPGSDTWLLANDGIFKVRDDRITSIPSVPGVHAFDAGQVVATPDGTLLATVTFGRPDVNGIWRYAHGVWTKITGGVSNLRSPTAAYVDARGRLWTGYPDGMLGLPLEDGGPWVSSGNPGLGAVFAILETSSGLFAGGLNGLAILRDNRLMMLDFADRDFSRGIGGLVESANGNLWLNAQRGVVSIPAAELQAALENSQYAMKAELVTEGEFIGPTKLRDGKSTTARDAEGRLWFVTMNGVFHTDPGNPNTGGRLPNLSIKSISADRISLNNGRTIDPRSQTLDIQYLGVNLTTPEKVIYRYQLEGYDSAWQDVGHRTEAIYTQLRPGRYTFRVMASNGDGKWTAPVSSAPFTVLPRFYQTPWFMMLVVLSGLLLLWFAFTVRVRILTRAIRAGAEERADERVRIARELHDTLLQGIQGLLLTVHVAAEKVSKGEDSKMLLERALSTADRIIVEGRNRVTGLRSEHLTDAELVGSIENVGKDLRRDDRIEFRVKREGIDAVLHAHVADEVYFIAREALTNAFRHAQASRIMVELNYGRRYFSLTCTDNGCGFESGNPHKPGHWGLKGLLERAQKVGGQLRIRSEHMRGTEIVLALPSYQAYEGHSRLLFYLRAHHRSERIPTES